MKSYIRPFVEKDFLEAVLTEMSTSAIQIGEALDSFFPESDHRERAVRESFRLVRRQWSGEFMPDANTEST